MGFFRAGYRPRSLSHIIYTGTTPGSVSQASGIYFLRRVVYGCDRELTSEIPQRLCVRQNQITRIDFPANIASSVTDLDLYDNLIGHIKGFDEFQNLTSLDLSFNKIKHIKNVSHLTKLTDLFFVQNKISRLEGLDGLTALRNLELGANRIRVGWLPTYHQLHIWWLISCRKSRIWTHFPRWRSYGSGKTRSPR